MPKALKSKQQPWVKRQTVTERYDKSTTFNYHSVPWRKLRLAVLIENPLCVECAKKGLIVEGSVVDHDKPINQGGDPWDRSNLQVLCYPCHQSKSAKDRYRKQRNEPT